MSDFNPAIGATLTNPVSGAQLAAWANDLAAFALSSGYGTSTPANAAAGQIWSKNTGGVPDPYVFDGSDDFLLYTAVNILGTVSADGSGENTGAVIETGYSSGTGYAKFAGGLAVAAAKLNNHPAGTETWTMPAGLTFTDTNKMWAVGAGHPQAYARFVTVRPATVNSFDVAMWTETGATSDQFATVFAMGFWTEEFL